MNDTVLIDGLVAAAGALIFGSVTVRLRVLSLSGALMAGALGAAVVLTQGWWWLLPLFAFLTSGALLGRLKHTVSSDAKHGKPRDALQVFCNGGLYALLACLCAAGAWRDFLMSVSICAATCDTWASEIGTYARRPTWNIATFKAVPPGLSGGVSGAGTWGGLLGAMLMASLCTWLAYPGQQEGADVPLTLVLMLESVGVLLLTAFAMTGMLLDSLLGGLLQAKYDDGQGLADQGTRRVHGLRWMTNDVVNLVSNACLVLFALALLAIR